MATIPSSIWHGLFAANHVPSQSIQDSVERFGCEDRVTLEKVRVLNLRFRGVICALNVFDDRFTASKEDLHERDAAKRDEYHGADRLA